MRAGVLVADGYGVSLRVLYGKLRVEDGIGSHRRCLALVATGPGLKRLVLLGKSGTLSLESLAWLRDIGAALIHLSADGDVLTHSVPFGYEGLYPRWPPKMYHLWPVENVPGVGGHLKVYHP